MSLTHALEDLGFPAENRDFIREEMEAIGSARYEGIKTKGYFRAIRENPESGPTIFVGWVGPPTSLPRRRCDAQ